MGPYLTVGSPIFLEDKDRCKAILASIPRLPHSGSRERSTIQHCNCLCRSKTRGNRTRPFCRWIHCERSSTDLNQSDTFKTCKTSLTLVFTFQATYNLPISQRIFEDVAHVCSSCFQNCPNGHCLTVPWMFPLLPQHCTYLLQSPGKMAYHISLPLRTAAHKSMSITKKLEVKTKVFS